MVNLLLGGNKKVFDGLIVTALSIAKNCDCAVKMYILTMDLREVKDSYVPLTEDNAVYLRKILKDKNSESDVILMDITETFKAEMLQSVNILNFYTPYTFLRLFAHKASLPEKILYIDTDVYICKDLQEMYDTDIEGYEFACIRDHVGKVLFGFNYFNAGILLLNLPEIKKSGLFERCVKMCNEKKLFFCDQTALNKQSKKRKYLKGCYNRQRNPKKDTVLLHFSKRMIWLPYPHTLNIKQWQVDKIHKYYKIYSLDDVLNDYLKRKQILEEEKEKNLQ